MVNPIVGKACPYLGRCDDPDNYYAFPTDGNCCYTEQGPYPIIASHQASACLGEDWAACPRYRAAKGESVPQESIALLAPTKVPWRAPPLWAFVVVAVVVGVVLAGLFLALRPRDTGDPPPATTSTLVAIESETPSAMLGTPTLAPDVTAVPASTSPAVLASPQASATTASMASPTATPTTTPSSTSTSTPSRTPTRTPSPTPTRMATATPSRTPTRTPSPTPTRMATATGQTPTGTPSSTPTRMATATPGQTPTGTPSPTPGPTGPSPAPVEPTATSTPLPAPILVAPPDRQEFSAGAEIILTWQSVGELAPDTYYAITVAYSHLGATWNDEVPWTQDTAWTLSEHDYLLDLSDDGQFRWSVQVVRQTGVDADGRPVGLPLSAPSDVRTLFWRRPSGGGGGTPPVPPP